MAKDILKEAIADAKAVREVALANAKAALEEAFTPKLQSMLSAKLTEELDEGEDIEEASIDEAEDMEETYMDEAEDVDEISIGGNIGPIGGSISLDEDDPEMEEDVTGMENEGMDENLDEEINLEEILAELELEEAKDSEEKTVEEAKDEDLDEAKKDEDKDDVKEADDKDLEEAKDDVEEAVGYPNHKADQVQKVHHQADDINRGLNESGEFNLDALLEEINNLDEKKDDIEEGDFGEAKKDEDTNEGFNTPGGVGAPSGPDPEAKKLQALASAATSLDDFIQKAQSAKLANVLLGPGVLSRYAAKFGLKPAASVAEMQTELNETKKALKTIKGELNEVNLLNSKLLYVNRIFKANTLDEGQKLRVVETLDKAESAKEAKLIYETIKDTFNVAKSKKASKNKSKTRTIKEGLGMASKAAGTSTAPKKEVIAESDNMVNRFQKLANIKINQ